MPFIPHTEADVKAMLETIGIDKIETLFDEIPETLKQTNLDGIPTGISELALMQSMRERAAADGNKLCFIGAGAYQHHIPAAVWEIATRGEFYTAYTPYQAEASQGSLQLIYEYQTMMANLMGMQVSNASLYDGASALAEAILMAVRLHKKGAQKILVPLNLHPFYRDAVKTIIGQQSIELIDVAYDAATGRVDLQALQQMAIEQVAALVIPQPNFFGVIEAVDALVNWADANNLLTIAVVNPLAMALLKPPGEWGANGVDIACGEGQPLGIPLAGGGPYYGFLCCKKAHVRQMPGRIVGKTVDQAGHAGYVLTLQAREQHIRRAKATSNICTNQGLMVTASTIYMSLMGPEGLRRAAINSHALTRMCLQALCKIEGVKQVFQAPFFHEVVVQLSQPVDEVIARLAERNIQAGYNLSQHYPALKNCLLICVTEIKTERDILFFTEQLAAVMQEVMA